MNRLRRIHHGGASGCVSNGCRRRRRIKSQVSMVANRREDCGRGIGVEIAVAGNGGEGLQFVFFPHCQSNRKTKRKVDVNRKTNKLPSS